MTKNTISPQVERILELIKTKEFTQRELTNLYDNILNQDQIVEEERELLVQALEPKIRSANPRQANNLFGLKEAKARELLQKLYDPLALRYNLSENCVGAGIKTGGDMIAGRADIDIYFSYKNNEKWHTTFSYYQVNADSDPKLIVTLYQGGLGNSVGKQHDKFDTNQSSVAVAKYTGHLTDIIMASVR
ncbi:MAG: hypothetical protein JKY17_06385 [Magnetovibrio sp.]|nr:hypothetical protein [Magnetovibrio sp.]